MKDYKNPYDSLVAFINRHHISVTEEMYVLRPLIERFQKEAFEAARELSKTMFAGHRYQSFEQWKKERNEPRKND